MGVKPIIEIDLQDEKFQRFYDLFTDYTAKLEEQPELWRDLGSAMGDAGHAFEAGGLSAKEALAVAAAQAGLITEALLDAEKAQHRLGNSSERTGKAMHGVARYARDAASAIKTVGGWILKLGALGGLGTIFSGFGVADLANIAFTRQRAAGQLGLSPGELAAFQVNAQQFLGTSALQAAANAQIDITKAGPLAALGIDYARAQGMRPSDLAFTELIQARAAYLDAQRHHQPAMQIPAISSYLALGGSLGDVRNAAMQPLSVLRAAQARTQADAKALEISREQAQEWTTLKQALDRAGVTIQSALIDRLAPLAPQIGVLADDLASFIRSILTSKNVGAVVDDLKSGLKDLADFVKRTPWSEVGAEISAVADRLHWLIPQKGDKGIGNTLLFGHGQDAQTFWKAMMNMPGERAIRGAWNALSGPFKSAYHTAFGWGKGDAQAQRRAALAAIVGTAKGLGVDPALALADALAESGLNPGAKGDYTKRGVPTSFGLYQLHRGGELGGLTPDQAFDPATNARVALRMFAQVMRSHPGWSPGAIALLAQKPSEYHTGMSRAQAEQTAYAKKVNAYYAEIVRAIQAAKPTATPHETLRAIKAGNRKRVSGITHVAITNSTAARVAVAVNGVSAV